MSTETPLNARRRKKPVQWNDDIDASYTFKIGDVVELKPNVLPARHTERARVGVVVGFSKAKWAMLVRFRDKRQTPAAFHADMFVLHRKKNA